MKTNLKAVRKKMTSYTQEEVANLTGIRLGTLRRWEQGVNEPDMGSVITLANLYGVSTDTILGTEFGENFSGIIKAIPSTDAIEVRVYGHIAAGVPIEMLESNYTHLVPKEIYDKHQNCGWLMVDGDSYNRKLPDGCLALVDFDMREPNEYAPFAVCVNGYSATVKSVKRLANGFELIPNSYDPTYTPVIYDYNKDDTDEITIIGQIVYASFPDDWL